MKRSAQFTGTVQNGRLPECVSDAFARCLRQAEGKRVSLTLQVVRRRRSNPQNAFYWGAVIPAVLDMFRDAGQPMDAEGVHEYLKAYVGRMTRIVLAPNGKRVTVLGSTADLNTMDFEVYLEQIRAWAAQFGVIIPLPNEEMI